MRSGILGQEIAVLAKNRIKIGFLQVSESTFVPRGSLDMLTLKPMLAVRLSAVVAFTIQSPIDGGAGTSRYSPGRRRQRLWASGLLR